MFCNWYTLKFDSIVIILGKKKLKKILMLLLKFALMVKLREVNKLVNGNIIIIRIRY